MSQIQKLVCVKCDTHLAIIEDCRVSIRFVVRDKRFQVYTIGGATIIRCRECGEHNLFMNVDFVTTHPEEAARLAGMARAKIEAWIPQDEFEKIKQAQEPSAPMKEQANV